jgi:hypothetical protein
MFSFQPQPITEGPLAAEPYCCAEENAAGWIVAEFAPQYRPRHSEESILYQVVAENIESFLARQQERGHVIPRFVEKELRAFLDCGILARG